jgi:hypothetical protein
MGKGVFPMLVMVAVAVPLYVCATSSTPIAAALALKGLSPGAALVFLLAGPATNAASLTVISRILGKKATAAYLTAIIACSLILGMVTNLVYEVLRLNVTDWVHGSSEESQGVISFVFAVILLGLVFRNLVRNFISKTRECNQLCPDPIQLEDGLPLSGKEEGRV